MADSTSIQIVASDQEDKAVNTTITDINPNAQPSDLKTLAQKLNALTTNTYKSTTLIQKTDIESAADKVVISPTFDVKKGSVDEYQELIGNIWNVPVSYQVANNVFAFRAVFTTSPEAIPIFTFTDGVDVRYQQIMYQITYKIWLFTIIKPGNVSTFQINITMPETVNQYAFSKNVTVTITEEE